jgi:hypothetical protein
MKYLFLLFFFIGCQSVLTPPEKAQPNFAGTWYMQGGCEFVIETGTDYLIFRDVKYIGTYSDSTFNGTISKEYNADVIQLYIQLTSKDVIAGYFSKTDKPNLYFDGVRLR